MRRRARNAPLIYYAPHEKQEMFHRHLDTKRIGLFLGGNRSGKSTANAAEVLAWAYGYRPWLVPGLRLTPFGDYPPRADVDPSHWIRRPDGVPIRHPCKVLVVTGLALPKGIANVMWPKLESFLPPSVLKHPDFSVQRGPFSTPVRCRLPNQSELIFGSGEQSAMQFEGDSFDAVGMDEPVPRGLFAPIWRGLTDYFGRLWISMTPIGVNAPWCFEEFITSDRTDVSTIQVSIYDNPHMSAEARTEFVEGGNFAEEEKAARISGAWGFLSHRAFPPFDPAVHVTAPYDLPRGWIRGCGVDPAHRRPFAVVWAAFGPNGEVVVYREWPQTEHHKIRSSSLTVRDYASIIRNLEGSEKIDFRVLDPRFGQAHPTVKGERFSSIAEDFAEYGLLFDTRIPGTEREETGIQAIREALRWDRSSPPSPINQPKLRVFAPCINTINSLALSNYVPPSLRDPDVLPERLLESYKDFRDALRYLILYPTPAAARDLQTSYFNERDFAESQDIWSL